MQGLQLFFSVHTKPIAVSSKKKYLLSVFKSYLCFDEKHWNIAALSATFINCANTKPIAGKAALKPLQKVAQCTAQMILNPLQAKQHWNLSFLGVSSSTHMYTKPIAGKAALKLEKSFFRIVIINVDTKPIAGKAALKLYYYYGEYIFSLILNPLQAKQHWNKLVIFLKVLSNRILNPLQAKQHWNILAPRPRNTALLY